MSTTPTNDDIAGAVMAALIGQIDEEGRSIADRVSVADLWSVLNITIPVVMQTLVEQARTAGAITFPRGGGAKLSALTTDEHLVAGNAAVRKAIVDGKKIQAIKEARAITGIGLKEAKDIVEMMTDFYKKTGTWLT